MLNWTLLWVFTGGGAGSVLRYLISVWIPWQGGFPWATLIANGISCIIVGVVLALSPFLNDQVKLLLLAGFCGGLSTFSTFSKETLDMVEQGHMLTAILYVLSSLVIGVLAIAFVYRLLYKV
jgi:fluoride exporter